jgi:hypothetical protein
MSYVIALIPTLSMGFPVVKAIPRTKSSLRNLKAPLGNTVSRIIVKLDWEQCGYDSNTGNGFGSWPTAVIHIERFCASSSWVDDPMGWAGFCLGIPNPERRCKIDESMMRQFTGVEQIPSFIPSTTNQGPA